jgi:alpha-tubulin suppressor-like RCC1 family protein
MLRPIANLEVGSHPPCWGLMIGLAGLMLACSAQPAYQCTGNSQCIGPAGIPGICESDKVCSFPDSSCSGTARRYADGLANACVFPTTCTSNRDCVSIDGKPGICEVTGRCSYFDSRCSTSRRVLDGLTNACVPAANSCISQLSLGGHHTCALRTDGAVYCWGLNADGEVGDGTAQDNPIPTRVAGLPLGKSVLQVAAAETHTCALLDDNTVWCWGANNKSALGQCDGANIPSSASPLRVPRWSASGSSPTCDSTKPFTAKSIGAGGKHNCALGTDGAVYCWGGNTHANQGGQCGQDPSVLKNVPGPLKLTGESAQNVTSVWVGDEYTCIIRNDQSVWCFGASDLFELGQGNGSTDFSYEPVAVTGFSDANFMAADDETACVVTRQSSLVCWGSGESGIFGVSHGNVDHATFIEDCSSAFGGGTSETLCMTQSDGFFFCFGENKLGQCGNGSTTAQVAPSDSSSKTFLATVSKASLGTGHSCAVTTDGALWCWGANDHGQLGDGQIAASSDQSVTVPKRISFPCL